MKPVRIPSEDDLRLIPMKNRCPRCYHWPYNYQTGHTEPRGCGAIGHIQNGKICGCKNKP